jgi:hypothetical protein
MEYPQMKPYLNTTLRNVLWFKQVHDKGELEMKPPFQRNIVWVDKQKSYLIDTILNGYPIPEIYMQEFVTESGKASYIIVDGQQRLRSVLQFLEGKLAIDGKDSPTWADMTFEDLTGDDKKSIYQYDFVVRILPEMDDFQIRAIFQRLNRNVLALNMQELRQATYWGAYIQLMNDLSNLDSWKDVDLFTPNDVRRMLDVEYISELSIAYLNGLQNKKSNLDKYYELYEHEFSDEQVKEVKTIFHSVLSEIVKILPSINKTRWNKKTDFYTLFLVFSNHKDRLPLSRDGRDLATSKLLTFASEIDRFVKVGETEIASLSKNARDYGAGIRASTDLGSRKKRAEALEKLLADVWER